MDELEDVRLDNGKFATTLDDDMQTIRGSRVVLQDIKHELMTFRGELKWHPEYGTSLQRHVKDEATPSKQRAVLREIMTVIARHPNVITGSERAEINRMEDDLIELEAGFEYTAETDQQRETAALVIVIDQDGVRVYES